MFMSPLSRHREQHPGTSSGEPPMRPLAPWLATHEARDPSRPEAEDFIRAIFARRFGAAVPSFAPVIVTLRDRTGILAAAGYRCAAREPLFLERYLDEPVECKLAAHPQAPARRGNIVEVGHLAARKPGEGRRLILLLGPHLAQQGFQWVASTVTQELRHLLVRLGLTPIVLGTADPRVLGDQSRLWGSYYGHRPVVVGGYLPQAMHQMRIRMARSTTGFHPHVA